MTRIPDLGATLSVSRLDTALKERKSLSQTRRHTSQRKKKRSPDTGGFAGTSADSKDRISGGCDGSGAYHERDAPTGDIPKSSFSHLEHFGKISSKDKLLSPDSAEQSEDIRISFTAAKLSPRSNRIKEKRHKEDVAEGDSRKELLRPELAPQVERLHTDVFDAADDDEGDQSRVVECDEGKVKSDVTTRPRSESRLSQSRRERTKTTRPSSGMEYSRTRGTAPWPQNPRQLHSSNASKGSGIPDGEDEASESKIRQIWRKELGLVVRRSRRQFEPKEYITGLVVGHPGQKAVQPQKVTTTVVSTAKPSVSEIQKRRKVLPPIDSKAKGKTSKSDDVQKLPAPNRVKDINALAVDLCRGATIEIGNIEAEAVYRTYREARKNAFYFDLQSNVDSARSQYHRPCHAPPNSDDDGDDDQGVQEAWNDSSYTRIVRIASPDNDGETVITHTVDASKVFEFGGRVIRKTQIDVFLPSEAPSDEIQSVNDDNDDDSHDDDDKPKGRCHDCNKNETDCDSLERVLQHQIASREQGSKRVNGQRERLIENKPNSAAYEEDDEEDSDDVSSEESSDSDDVEDDDDYY